MDYIVLIGGKNYETPGAEGYPPICNLQDLTMFQLRGVCHGSKVDSFYILEKEKELIGYRQSKVVWSKQQRRWNIVDMLNGDIANPRRGSSQSDAWMALYSH